MTEKHTAGQAHPTCSTPLFPTVPCSPSTFCHLGVRGAWPWHREVPVLRSGTDSPAEAGGACQSHVHLRYKHNHLWPVHEAQPIMDTDVQAPLQDL